MEAALYFIAGAVLLGMGAVGAAIGIGILADSIYRSNRETTRTAANAARSVLHHDGDSSDAVPMIGVGIAFYILFAVA